jgi:chaperonin GroEL
MENANIKVSEPIVKKGEGINAITGERVDMIKAGIIDPVLVTKTALKNAISVATTIMSADCIISNMRINESH